MVNTNDIVGIFDLDNTSTSRLTKSFLRAAQKAGEVVAVSQELPKSFVVCERDGQRQVFLSHISPLTLKKRAKQTASITPPG